MMTRKKKNLLVLFASASILAICRRLYENSEKGLKLIEQKRSEKSQRQVLEAFEKPYIQSPVIHSKENN